MATEFPDKLSSSGNFAITEGPVEIRQYNPLPTLPTAAFPKGTFVRDIGGALQKVNEAGDAWEAVGGDPNHFAASGSLVIGSEGFMTIPIGSTLSAPPTTALLTGKLLTSSRASDSNSFVANDWQMRDVNSSIILPRTAPPGNPFGTGFGAMGVVSGNLFGYTAIMHGGSYWDNNSSETWGWSRTGGWTNLNPNTTPSVFRFGIPALVCDSVNGVIVAFGGTNNGGWETWTFDGTDWTQQFPFNSPTISYGFAYAYDSDRGRIVIFGGSGTNQTWEWDGTTWTQIFPIGNPSASNDYVATYDKDRQRVIMTRGDGDTWEYDTATWQQKAPSNSLMFMSGPVGEEAVMAYNVGLKVVLTFGGQGLDGQGNFFVSDQLWGYKFEEDPNNLGSVRTRWYRIDSGPGPAGRIAAAMFYDEASQSILLFGGFNWTRGFQDVWEYKGKWVQLAQNGEDHSTIIQPGKVRPFIDAQIIYDDNNNTFMLYIWGTTGHTYYYSYDLRLTELPNP